MSQNLHKKTEKPKKKISQNSSEKKPKCFSKKNQNNPFWLFHRSDGIGTLFSQHEPRKLEKSTTCPLENHFSHLRQLFWQLKVFGSRKNSAWSTKSLGVYLSMMEGHWTNE